MSDSESSSNSESSKKKHHKKHKKRKASQKKGSRKASSEKHRDEKYPVVSHGSDQHSKHETLKDRRSEEARRKTDRDNRNGREEKEKKGSKKTDKVREREVHEEGHHHHHQHLKESPRERTRRVDTAEKAEPAKHKESIQLKGKESAKSHKAEDAGTAKHHREEKGAHSMKRARSASASSSSSASESESSSDDKKKKKKKGRHKKHEKSKKKDKKKKKKKGDKESGPDPNQISTWTVEYVYRWTEAFAGLQPALKLKEEGVDGKRLANLLSPDQLSQIYDIPQAPASLLFGAVQGQLAKEEAIKEAQAPKKSKKSISTFGDISATGGFIEAAACKGGPKPPALTARDVLANYRYAGGGKIRMGNALIFTGPES